MDFNTYLKQCLQDKEFKKEWTLLHKRKKRNYLVLFNQIDNDIKSFLNKEDCLKFTKLVIKDYLNVEYVIDDDLLTITIKRRER